MFTPIMFSSSIQTPTKARLSSFASSLTHIRAEQRRIIAVALAVADDLRAKAKGDEISQMLSDLDERQLRLM